jgi:hypothetical protein
MTHDSSLETRYPSLWLFFAGYLYQCWHDEYADEWAAADEFVRREPQCAPDFHREMAQLVSAHPDEASLRSILLDGFGAAAMVENRGWKYRDWMQAVAAHIERAVGHPQAS